MERDGCGQSSSKSIGEIGINRLTEQYRAHAHEMLAVRLDSGLFDLRIQGAV